MPDDLKTEVEGKVAAVRTALEGEGVDVYKQDAPGEGPQAPDDGPAPGSDDTVEGEYREV